MNTAFFHSLHKLALRLARVDIAYYLLPPLMILLVAGTVAQRTMGLYAAQKMFFSSFIVWVGPLPLPGGYTLTACVAFTLTLKFILKSKWSWRKAGIILSHFGSLTLLIGGFFTALAAQESYMILGEGEESPYIYDYHKRQLSVYDGDKPVLEVPFEKLTPGQVLTAGALQITVRAVCTNCDIGKRTDVQGGPTYKSMAQFMVLSPKKNEKEPEENLSGVTFDLAGARADENGRYIAFDVMPRPVAVSSGRAGYTLIFGKAQRVLPFSVGLRDFKEELYPGVNKARAYSSDLVIFDGGLEWPVRVEMNKPLRYKGYTFYQSSFERTPEGKEMSVLSVVHNRGRLVPYIGTFILTLGLILHLFRPKKNGEKKAAA